MQTDAMSDDALDRARDAGEQCFTESPGGDETVPHESGFMCTRCAAAHAEAEVRRARLDVLDEVYHRLYETRSVDRVALWDGLDKAMQVVTAMERPTRKGAWNV